MQKFTYHCHTNFSDGSSSIEDMIGQAAKLGFSEIGISDHIEIHKNFSTSPDQELIKSMGWADKMEDSFDKIKPSAIEHIKQIREVAQKHSIKALVGFEVDFFNYDGWLQEFNNFRQDLDIDYLISGNHFTTTPDDSTVFFVTSISKYAQSDEAAKQYIKTHFQNIKEAIKSGIFTFVAHLDFIRWGKIVGEFDYRDERMELIELLAKTGTPTELNTKGLASIGDFYPAMWMLKELKSRKIPLVISDDAHHATQLGRDFDKAEALLESIDYKHRFDLKHLIK